MTDGVNTIENAMPLQLLRNWLKIITLKYSIGIGTNGYALMPTQTDIFGDLVFTETEVKIDEPVLKEVAQMTGGKYFRQHQTAVLKKYDEINQLEKSDIKVGKLLIIEEYFKIFLWIALGMLFLDALLRWVFYKLLS
jgi:Ca-activated chloride channel family protein